MKVGIDISQAVYGTGVSDYVINLVQHLPQSELVLFGFSLRRKSDITTPFPSAKTFLIPPTFLDIIWNRLHILPAETLIGPVDILHSSDWTQPPTQAKKVTTIHDLAPFIYPQETSPNIVAVQTRRMKWVVKECDQIICVSQNTANDLKLRFKVQESRIKVVYEALPTRYQLKPQITKYTNYILAIGARQPRKNIQRLITACRELKLKLIIVGEPPSTLPLSSSPALIYTGYVTDQDLVNYLAGTSAFVYPSLYEGFGLPILGAFYHGAPVACSNTSSLPEVAGDAAAYFDPLSVESIAAGITQAIADRDRLVAAGTKQLAKFSWAKTAQQTLDVYKSIC